MTSGADPGWRPALRGVPRFLIPFMWLWRFGTLSRSWPPDVVTLRSAYLGFLASPVLFLIVLLLIMPLDAETGTDATTVAALVAGLGTVALAAVLAFRRRRIDCGEPVALARAYVSLVFVRVAFAEAAILFGFVGSFRVGALWPYLIGLGFGAVGLAVTAPTAADIDRHDEHLRATGCPHSVRGAL